MIWIAPKVLIRLREHVWLFVVGITCLGRTWFVSQIRSNATIKQPNPEKQSKE